MWHLPWKSPPWTLPAKSMNWINSSIVLSVTIFHKNIGRFIFWIERLLRRMTFKGSIQMRTRFGASFSMWIPTKPLAQITLHHEYLRHVLNSLLTFFALYLMHVSPQILFQLLGKLHALCLLGDSGGVVNSLDFCPASLKSLGCFYFRCVLSSQWQTVTVNLRILHCQL